MKDYIIGGLARAVEDYLEARHQERRAFLGDSRQELEEARRRVDLTKLALDGATWAYVVEEELVVP